MKEINPSDPKWFAFIGDRKIDVPQQVVRAELLIHLANLPKGTKLVRDYDSQNDAVLGDEGEVDLGIGNVFRIATPCENPVTPPCDSLPKLAFAVNDRVEVTTRRDHEAEAFRLWFGIEATSQLVRDYEGPADRKIKKLETIMYGDGPVFTTACCEKATLEIATPRGMFTGEFAHGTTVAQVIEAVIKAKKLTEGDLFDLVRDGKVLGKAQTLAELKIWCHAEFDLVATGAGV